MRTRRMERRRTEFGFRPTAPLDEDLPTFPSIAVNLWVLTSRQHDAEHCPRSSPLGIAKRQRSQTSGLCLILILARAPLHGAARFASVRHHSARLKNGLCPCYLYVLVCVTDCCRKFNYHPNVKFEHLYRTHCKTKKSKSWKIKYIKR